MSTIRAVASPELVTKADRFFRNDDPSVFTELLQNSRRAGATMVIILIEPTSEESSNSRICFHDNGHGIGNFQNLLNFGGGSGWDGPIRQSEDPAGMGFFSLCHSNVEVASGNTAVSLTPESFLGGVDVELIELADPVTGTRIEFTRASKATHLVAAAQRAAEFYPIEVYVNGVPVERHDFLEGALYRELIDGIEVGLATNFRWQSTLHNENWNFYGLQIHQRFNGMQGKLRFDERLGWFSETIHARFNVLNTGVVKLQLPDRRGIVQGEQLNSFLSKARAATFRYFQSQPKHALSFAHWKEAKQLGVDLPEASPFLHTWHASPLDEGLSCFFKQVESRLLEAVTDVLLVASSIENRHTLEAALRPPSESGWQLYQEAAGFQGYSWYDALPLLLDTEVLVDGKVYETWLSEALPRPETMQIVLTITQLHKHDSLMRLPAVIHVVDEEDDWNGLTFDNGDLKFVAIQNSPWDNDQLDGPFDVVGFLVSATFRSSDDPNSDSWETQENSFRESAEREVNEYFRGPRAALIALLRDALSWEVRRLAKEVGIREIRFLDRSPEDRGWEVELITKEEAPPAS